MRALAVTSLFALMAASAAHASTYEPEDCRKGTETLEDAIEHEQRIYRRLHPPRQIVAIQSFPPKEVRPEPTPPTVRALLRQMLAHRCMRVARRLLNEPLPTSEPAVRAWLERGGHEWIRSALKRNPRIVMLSVPPSFRPWYDRESIPQDHPLTPFVCPANAEVCGSRAQGWLHRARHEEHMQVSTFQWAASCHDNRTATDWAECLLRARRFAARDVLPDGLYRSPVRGELIWTSTSDGAWWFDLTTSKVIRIRTTGQYGGSYSEIVEGLVSQSNLREATLRFALDAHRVRVQFPKRLDAYYYRNDNRAMDVGAILDKLENRAEGMGGIGAIGGSDHRTEGWSFAPVTDGNFSMHHGITREDPSMGAATDSMFLKVTRLGFVGDASRKLTQAEDEEIWALITKGAKAHDGVRAWLKRKVGPTNLNRRSTHPAAKSPSR